MKLSFDISSLPYGTGVSMYTSNLVRALSRLEKDVDLQVFGFSLRKFSALEKFANQNKLKHKLYMLPPSIGSSLFSTLPIDPFCGFADIFHAWDWYLPRSIKTNVVTTIHDVALFKYPEIAHPEIKEHHQQVILQAKSRNLHLIAVSDSTKQDLIELFDINPDLVNVVHEALPEEQCIAVDDEIIGEVKKEYGLNKPYLLIVGTKEPRKNVPRQIEAWREFKADYDLVVVGKSGWEDVSKEDGVHILDYVSDKNLAALYRGASILLYASLAEGFGLPLLEAFYHHTPVVTSNRSSLKEIAGDAAVLVEPEEVSSISQGIKEALDHQNQLSAQSMARLNDFSWEKAAAETLSVYQEILGTKGK